MNEKTRHYVLAAVVILGGGAALFMLTKNRNASTAATSVVAGAGDAAAYPVAPTPVTFPSGVSYAPVYNYNYPGSDRNAPLPPEPSKTGCGCDGNKVIISGTWAATAARAVSRRPTRKFAY